MPQDRPDHIPNWWAWDEMGQDWYEPYVEENDMDDKTAMAIEAVLEQMGPPQREKYDPDFNGTETHLKLAVESLKQIQNWAPGDAGGRSIFARFGVVHHQNWVFRKDYACHAAMAHPSDAYGTQGDPRFGPKVVFSKWNYHPDERFAESGRAWFDWITGPTSPWRSVLPPKNIRVGDDDLASSDFMWNHGFIFWHIDKLPSNAQQSFLIATRQASQHPNFVKVWHEWVTVHGMDPAFAMAYLPCWNDQEYGMYNGAYSKFHLRKNFEFSISNFCEFPLNNATMDCEYVQNFMAGRMVQEKLNKPYSESCTYTPVNSIWHTAKDARWIYSNAGSHWQVADDVLTYTKFLEKTYNLGKSRAANSAFAKSPNSKVGHKFFTLDEVLEIARREQRRIADANGADAGTGDATVSEENTSAAA
jgi:hypothetical protein